MPKKLTKLTPQQWKQLRRVDKNHRGSEMLRVPWGLFEGNSSLIFNYVDSDNDLTQTTVFKAFIILQHYFMFKTCDIDQQELMDSYEISLTDCTMYGSLKQRVRETKLKASIQYQYIEDVKEEGFLWLPYDKFDSSRGKLGMLVEAILYTYKVDSFETLWRIIYSKLGTEVHERRDVSRYIKSKGISFNTHATDATQGYSDDETVEWVDCLSEEFYSDPKLDLIRRVDSGAWEEDQINRYAENQWYKTTASHK